MKTLILLLMILSSFLFYGCQSEYHERMEKALRLKEDYLKIKSSSADDQALSKIKDEIFILAKISGNEDTFIEELGIQ